MACRLAEAGLRICLLERGKAYPLGSFPRMQNNFWDPSEGLYGLFNPSITPIYFDQKTQVKKLKS
jgi:cholesterol oxidase